MIKLHWASSKPNFGDWLSPAICELLSRKEIRHAKVNDCDMMAIGSILQRKKEHFWNRRIHIWGSGLIEQTAAKRSRHYYHAVRGKYTASKIANTEISAHGDPGLLSDQLLGEHHLKKRHSLGIVPHYEDKNAIAIKNLLNAIPNSIIIDVMQEPIEVLKQITQCEHILSSSLHGLVVSDSLEIPNHWIKLSDKVRGAGWKFNDYYSAFGIEDRINPLELADDCHPLTQDEITQRIGNYHRPNLTKIKQQLIDNFPFPGGTQR